MDAAVHPAHVRVSSGGRVGRAPLRCVAAGAEPGGSVRPQELALATVAGVGQVVGHQCALVVVAMGYALHPVLAPAAVAGLGQRAASQCALVAVAMGYALHPVLAPATVAGLAPPAARLFAPVVVLMGRADHLVSARVAVAGLVQRATSQCARVAVSMGRALLRVSAPAQHRGLGPPAHSSIACAPIKPCTTHCNRAIASRPGAILTNSAWGPMVTCKCINRELRAPSGPTHGCGPPQRVDRTT